MNAKPDSEQVPEEQTPAEDTPTAEGGPEGEPPIPSFERDKPAEAPEPADPEQVAPAQAAETADADRIAALEAEVADLKDKMLRAVAEQENVRRRASKDVENASRRSVKTFAGDLLAVADNLRRAIDSVDEKTRKDHPAIENVLVGVDMTERELMAAFARHGITRMQPVGERFDPNFHEAMFEYDDPEQPAGTVGQVIETGYLIQGQPLRAAKVGVTRGGSKPEARPETKPEAAAPAGEGETAAEPANKGAEPEPGSHIDENL